jgi:hypothetical protein
MRVDVLVDESQDTGANPVASTLGGYGRALPGRDGARNVDTG